MIDWELFYGRLRTPDFLPGYEIQNRLGGGAFGEVYKATKRSIGKDYAVKFLKVAEGNVAERELQQVSYFASIDHPNLVSVEDVGIVMGVPYLIMGYAGEDTLARRMRRGEVDRGTLLRFFVQTCRGALALHDRRLAHFDIKPSNVFLRGDVARLGDYGLAKLLADGRQTLSFGRGTPHYMAPEMMKNRGDLRADVYSLGVMLYEGLTGKVPFGLGSDAIVREDDEPPDFPDDVPPALRRVIVRATRFDAGDRYASVRELLADLGEAEPETPTPAAPAPRAAAAPPGAGGSDELRRTAAELARGAVGVARGVWDGVVGRGSEQLPPLREEESDPTDIVSLETLDEPAPPTPRRVGRVLAILASERARRLGEETPSAALRVLSPWQALPSAGALAAGRTIPVPPAVEGGLHASVAATVALGFEVFVALVSGPVLVTLRAAGRGVERLLSPVPGVVGAALKLLLFLAFLAFLGALLAGLAVFLAFGSGG